MRRIESPARSWRRLAATIAGSLVLAGCGGGGGSGGGATNTPVSQAGGASQVLPVAENPIKNSSTVQALKIDSVKAEDNVDPRTGKDAGDHLEIALRNTGSAVLSNFEVYYTFTDPKKKTSENYYARLGDAFTIPPGEKRVAHFDGTTAPDHFPVNKFSLYYTSKAALDIRVTVSASDAAVQTATIKKDAGGAENPNE